MTVHVTAFNADADQTLAVPSDDGCHPRRRLIPSKSPTLRRWRPAHDALDHHGRDAREHGLGHWGRQNIANRVRHWRLPSRLDLATEGLSPVP